MPQDRVSELIGLDLGDIDPLDMCAVLEKAVRSGLCRSVPKRSERWNSISSCRSRLVKHRSETPLVNTGANE